jgi:transcriptional regulator with XRE-family HTH domain
LGRRSGVAAPQITRLERGDVKKPTIETLVALARGLDCNPVPLLILAGYVEIDEARARLQDCHAPGSEYLEEASQDPESDPDVAAIRAELANPEITPARLRELAFDVWFGGESGETLWDDVYAILPALGESQTELREIVTQWSGISFDRRARILAYVRDQYALSLAEIRAETDAAKAGLFDAEITAALAAAARGPEVAPKDDQREEA